MASEGNINRCLTEEEEEVSSSSDEFYDAEDEPSMTEVVPSVSVATPEGVPSGNKIQLIIIIIIIIIVV